MRFSQVFIPTLRESPSDAETIAHQLMLRAGLIRKLAPEQHPEPGRLVRRQQRQGCQATYKCTPCEIHTLSIFPGTKIGAALLTSILPVD